MFETDDVSNLFKQFFRLLFYRMTFKNFFDIISRYLTTQSRSFSMMNRLINHPIYVFGVGLVAGVTGTFGVLIYFQGENYIKKENAKTYLETQGKMVIDKSYHEKYCDQAGRCSELESNISNLEDVINELNEKVATQESDKKELTKENNRLNLRIDNLLRKFSTKWDYKVDGSNTARTKCIADGEYVGSWHDCSTDKTCGNEQLIRGMCAYRYLSSLSE